MSMKTDLCNVCVYIRLYIYIYIHMIKSCICMYIIRNLTTCTMNNLHESVIVVTVKSYQFETSLNMFKPLYCPFLPTILK